MFRVIHSPTLPTVPEEEPLEEEPLAASEGPPSPDASRLALRPLNLPDFDASELRDMRSRPARLSLPEGPRLQDVLTVQVDQRRRSTVERLQALSARIHNLGLSDASMAAGSRMVVMKQVLSEVTTASTPARLPRHTLFVLDKADRLLAQAEQVLKLEDQRFENLRRACLNAATRTRLSRLLDPDFLQRIVDRDLQPMNEAPAVALANGQNPFQCFRPQFSCWKQAPVPPALPHWEEAPHRISSERVLEIWAQWVSKMGTRLSLVDIQRLSYAPGAGEADVQTLVSEWMKLPVTHAAALMTSDSRIVAVRVGTRAAERVFPGRAAHELARYCPYTRTLVVGVKVGDGRLEIPSNHQPFTDGRPSRFWTELGRMLVRGAWNEAATTVLPPAEPAIGHEQDDPCVTECLLDLPHDSFLEALAIDAETGSIHFPLGPSEEETHARVVGLHLCGASLPPMLRHYVKRRLSQTPGV